MLIQKGEEYLIEIKKLKKIGSGREGEVYELDDSKVLKLYNKTKNENLVIREFETIKTLNLVNLPIPKVFEFVKINDRPGLVMEKIDGESINVAERNKPWLNIHLPNKLAKLHIQIHEIDNLKNIPLVNDSLKEYLGICDHLPKHLAEFVIKTLNELPVKNNLCHGDFHAGNIMIRKGEFVLIDWGNVCLGDPLSDIARTLIIQKGPGRTFKNKLQGYINRASRNGFASRYLKAYYKFKPFDNSMLYKWQIVRAAEEIKRGKYKSTKIYFDFLERSSNNKGKEVLF